MVKKMNAAMTQQPDIYSALRDHSLSDHFRHSGEVLAEEAVVLGSIIRHILMRGECINNKNIILRYRKCIMNPIVKRRVFKF